MVVSFNASSISHINMHIYIYEFSRCVLVVWYWKENASQHIVFVVGSAGVYRVNLSIPEKRLVACALMQV